MHLTLATIAAFDVPRQSPGHGNPTKHLEAYGLLWGHHISWRADSSVYSIEHVTVDGHAKASQSSILPSYEYRQKMGEVMHSFWPAERLVGEFHSHPYKTLKAFPVTPGLSDEDRAQVEETDTADFFSSGMRVFFVCSITVLKKRAWAVGGYNPSNQLSWSMGRYKLMLTAYVAAPPRLRKNAKRLLLLPQHRGWPGYRPELSSQQGLVELSAPAGRGIEDFSDFTAAD